MTAILLIYAILAQLPPSQKDGPPRGVQPEIVSLIGKPLYALQDPLAVQKAYGALAADPNNVELLIQVAKVRTDLWQFTAALDLYTSGMGKAPADPRLYRLRGHRFISLRRFDDAAGDLEKGRELAPASFDISYHLGLAYYLQGEYSKAADEYARCIRIADEPQTVQESGGKLPAGYRSCAAMNEDTRVAIAAWRYLALRRAGRVQEAQRLLLPIHDHMQIAENTSYYRALLLFKKLRTEEQTLDRQQLQGNQWVTAAYPAASYALMQGDPKRGCAMMREITDTPFWASFGYIAAEVDIARGRVCR